MADPGSVPQGRIRRTMPLAGLTARAAGERMVAELRERSGDTGAVARFHERTAERYTELLGHSKGVLMKVGQIVSMVDTGSTGGDELSPYQRALTRLQADAPPMDPRLAKDVLRADLGRSAEQVFAEFVEEPMAAASIGQVHRAVLHDGREVAVKIQYPGAAEAIGADLANTELLATFLRFAGSASGTATPDLRGVTREIVDRVSEEIDYRQEAANIAAFSDLYRGHPFIRVPDVVHEASGDRVLTMTYLDGIDWAAAQHADQVVKNSWAEAIWRFSTGSCRHANLFNADPHPGNYRFGVDGTVGFVDFGCVRVFPENRRRAVVGLNRAVAEGRKEDTHALLHELGYFADVRTLTVDEAYEWMADVSYEVLAPQPVTFTRDTARRAVSGDLPPDHPLRRVSIPQDQVFFSRINLGVTTICAALGATVHLRALLDDMDGVAEPITPLGKQHRVWVRQRGLPYGMDSHDHC